MICPHCHSEVPLNCPSCTECGASITSDSWEAPPTQQVLPPASFQEYPGTKVFAERYDLIEELNIPIKYLSSNFWTPVEVNEDALTVVTDEPTNVMRVSEIISVVNRHGYH